MRPVKSITFGVSFVGLLNSRPDLIQDVPNCRPIFSMTPRPIALAAGWSAFFWE